MIPDSVQERIAVLLDHLYDHPHLADWAGNVIRRGPATPSHYLSLIDSQIAEDPLWDADSQAAKVFGGSVYWVPHPAIQPKLFELARPQLTDEERFVADLAQPVFDFFQSSFLPPLPQAAGFDRIPDAIWLPFFALLERGRILVRSRPYFGWSAWHGFRGEATWLWSSAYPGQYSLSSFPAEADWVSEERVRAWAEANGYILVDAFDS